jgi:hypothetical protein
VYPHLPKQGDHHIAMRFGDRWWDVWLDGVKIEGANEALAGPQGFVIYLSDHKGSRHVCGLPKHLGGRMDHQNETCQHVAYGRVERQP